MSRRRLHGDNNSPGNYRPGKAPATSGQNVQKSARPKNRLHFDNGGRLPDGGNLPESTPPPGNTLGEGRKSDGGHLPDGSRLPDISPAAPDTTASPDTPARRLRFDSNDTPPPTEAPHDSGQKPKRRKFQLEEEQARPSERLRHEGEAKAPADGIRPPPGTSADVPSGGAAPTPGKPGPIDKKLLREGKRINKSKFRMEKTGDKLDAARDTLAAQKPLPKPGIADKAGRGIKNNIWMFVHGKIYQVENENVGTKAAHRSELAGEGVVHSTSRFVKRRIRTRPARRVRKLEKRDIKAKADYHFRKAAQDNPELKKNAATRYIQKRRLRKIYQKQARQAAGKTSSAVLNKAALAIKKMTGAVLALIKSNPKVTLILLAAFLLFVMVQSCVGGALTIGNGILGGIGGTSYLAEDADINGAGIAYSEWEIDLLMEALNAETSHPGYDEYRYFIDPIGHDPHALLSFLTAKYDDFTFAGVEAVLRDIFNQQYSLTFTEIIEVRSYEETWTDEDGESHTETIYYDYYILEVTLTAKPFTDVIIPLLETVDEQERYDVYNIIRGNRQYVGSPFPYNWLPYVSSYFGYRQNPFTGVKEFHTGIDIALPEGTEIQAGGKGVVVSAGDAGDYGLMVVIEYTTGATARYAHCSSLLVSAGQEVVAGQAIAKVGSIGASTGPHLHAEVIKDGEYMNPLYFMVIPF